MGIAVVWMCQRLPTCRQHMQSRRQGPLHVYSIAEILKDFDVLITFQAGMPWTLSRTVGLQPSLLMWAQSKLTPSEHSGRASQIRSESSSRQVFCTQGIMQRQCLPQSTVHPGLRRSVFLLPKAQLVWYQCKCLHSAHFILCLPGFKSVRCSPL